MSVHVGGSGCCGLGIIILRVWPGKGSVRRLGMCVRFPYLEGPFVQYYPTVVQLDPFIRENKAEAKALDHVAPIKINSDGVRTPVAIKQDHVLQALQYLSWHPQC